MRHTLIILLLFGSAQAQKKKAIAIRMLVILSIILYSCSSVPQIQLPSTTNYATKGYVDTAINNLKSLRAQDKKTIDSLKNVITINTIKVDTTSGSDFNISNGVISFNKVNLNRTIKTEVLRQLPIPNKVIAKKKKK